ncbi:d-glycero-D-manno-heptose 1-phosphate guanosyltransferase [Myroides odoratimimus]|uniref:nucleotidyltransferase family protein n=1 Tax=Myroides odoratimimus TaxID=76832 RepID=UPI00072615B1|nr:nucleotidyltransferase family protein [Myroides odoratimimus]GAQ14822.1 d-glycero-D-manno-heptose 1-phosphate guanosyltransferase [Myroides odoratimimus]STZ48879.1 Glucose-1-phosphate thymidylyltransferase [Myroides odoratimimus]
MKNIVEKHTICKNKGVREALVKLDANAPSSILFVTDEENKLIGSLTDGDLRRGFIKGFDFNTSIIEFIQPNPVYIETGKYDLNAFDCYRKRNLKVIPILNIKKQIIDILDFNITSTLIPADAVLMAGGEGKRLRPLTENTPKPLLKVGEKPIIEYNIDRLINCGIKTINLSINYLGDQLIDYFGDGLSKGVSIQYVKEDKPLGTIGSILLVDDFHHDDIIVMNSDLLTNIDFADFYKMYKESGADMAVAATSYHVDVPYAVLEVNNDNQVNSLKEKPRYTYYSNAGIYILNKSLLKMIPSGEFFDITDLMERILEMNLKLVTYPINGYWLDIGKHDDFKKAQEDIKHIKL